MNDQSLPTHSDFKAHMRVARPHRSLVRQEGTYADSCARSAFEHFTAGWQAARTRLQAAEALAEAYHLAHSQEPSEATTLALSNAHLAYKVAREEQAFGADPVGRCVRGLFRSGSGEVADRLVLMSADGKDLGGLAFGPVRDRVQALVKELSGEPEP